MTNAYQLTNAVQTLAEARKAGSYYDTAEKWTHIFWSENCHFRLMFDRLDLTSVVELACGHGRHAELIAGRCRSLTLVDVLPESIEFCRRRLSRFNNITYVINDGYKFDGIEDNSTTAIFCYDAMVHFSYDLVRASLVDAHRILRPGGMALFHHSNYAAPSTWATATILTRATT